MRKYKYSAIDGESNKHTGEIVVETKKELFIYLKSKGLYCTSYRQEGEEVRAAKNPLKMKELIIVSRQLGTMLDSGVSVIKALDIIKEQSEDKMTKQVFTEIYEDVQKGSSLSEAFNNQGKTFPNLFISMIESGEMSGTLDQTLLKVSAHYEKENKLHNKVKTAMMYPIILSVISIGIILILMLFVMPSFFEMFEASAEELPVTTIWLMNMSEYLQEKWYNVVITLTVIGVGVMILLKTDVFKAKWDGLKLKIPAFGKLNKIVMSARFAETLATLYSNGVPLIEAINITQRVLGNSYLDQKFEKAKEDVAKGSTLSDVVRNMEVFPDMLSNMVYVGEESGQLEEVLNKTAEFYAEESEAAIQKMVSLIEPILIIILGGIVGLIIASILPAMYISFEQIG